MEKDRQKAQAGPAVYRKDRVWGHEKVCRILEPSKDMKTKEEYGSKEKLPAPRCLNVPVFG